MFCGNCGKKLIDGSLFCMECGTPVPVGRFAGTPSPAQQSPAFSGGDKYNNAENSYNAPNEADLFGTNSFSEEAISAFSGAMNAFGAQGFQVPTVEDVDLSTGRVRQKAPKNKGDDILVENFSMTEGNADTEVISNDLRVIEGCSMDDDTSKDIILDPYRFLGDSMEEMSLESEKAEMPTASAEPVSSVEPLSVEPISFSAVSPEDNFAKLAAEPDIQPSVTVEPIFPWQQNAVEPVAEQVKVPAVEQIAEPVVEKATEPAVEQVVKPAVEQVAEPVVEQAAEPVIEQAEEPPVIEDVIPVIEQVEDPVIEQIAVSVVEQVAVAVADQVAVPVVEPIAKPSAEQTAQSVVEPTAKPAAEQTAQPVVESAVKPAAEHTAEPAAKQYVPPMTEPPVIQPTEPPKQPQIQQPEQQPRSYEPMPPAPHKKGIPVWLFILVLLGLVAAVVIILLNMNK